MDENINLRIRKIRMHFCNDSNIDFAKRMGEHKNTVNNWVRDGYSVGMKVLRRLINKFSEVNGNWLLTGDGDMLKENAGGDISIKDVSLKDIDGYVAGTHHGSVNYNGLSKEDMMLIINNMAKEYTANLEERYQHFKRKEEQVEQIFEENRMLTNECRKLNDEKEKLNARITFLTDKIFEKNNI